MRVDICIFSLDPPEVRAYVDKPTLFMTLPIALVEKFKTDFSVSKLGGTSRYPWIKLHGNRLFVDSNDIEIVVEGIINLNNHISDGDLEITSKAVSEFETLIKESVKDINKWLEKNTQLRLIFNDVEK